MKEVLCAYVLSTGLHSLLVLPTAPSMSGQLRQVAQDILALEFAANLGTDADSAAAAVAETEAAEAANRLLNWARAQLTRDGAAAADAEAPEGADSRTEPRPAADPAVAQDGEQQEQQQQQTQAAEPAAASEHDLLTHNAVFDETAWPEPRLLPRADADDRERWDFARRSGGFHKSGSKAGPAQGSQAALAEMRRLSLICKRPGCGALVDYKVARRQAKQDGRSCFKPGDGCAGPAPCSADHRPPRFRKRQREHAERMEAGERLLVRWPRDLDDHDVWAYSAEAAAAAAKTFLQ